MLLFLMFLSSLVFVPKDYIKLIFMHLALAPCQQRPLCLYLHIFTPLLLNTILPASGAALAVGP
jgi:hypothetical protein